MSLSRRDFLSHSTSSLAFLAFLRASHGSAPIVESLSGVTGRAAAQAGPLALPPGFTQTVISTRGEEMSDGLLVPGKHDGMAAFDGGGGKVLLVRNHEIDQAMGTSFAAYGPKLERVGRIAKEKIYDAGANGIPCMGGTTTILYDPIAQKVEKHFLSLTGTGVNCAGGRTPWGTWITCEECVYRADGKVYAKDHGYCFEVPANADSGLVEATPLRGLGRFTHEAIAVDPKGSIIYLTEDLGDSVFYRFLATKPGSLAEGGRLQALRIIDRPKFDGRNWPELDEKGAAKGPPIITTAMGDRFRCAWFDVDEVEAPKNDLRLRAYAKGAMRFARCEGIWHTGDAVYIAATTGGPMALGQLWRYVPSPHEGTEAESTAPATIELFVESRNAAALKNCDNLCASPWGELFVCEDGTGRDGIVRIRPNGEAHRFAFNILNDSELAGVCFSGDGETLFVNIQDPGLTIAIRGPWVK